MKALTLTQPWATLVAIGAKRIETRSWQTTYRGPLAIHAAKTFPKDAHRLSWNEPFFTPLYKARFWTQGEIPSGFEALPFGAIVATCQLRACVRTEEIASELSAHERAFGDYAPGRFAWRLENVRMLPAPIPAKGALGLWEWNEAPACST